MSTNIRWLPVGILCVVLVSLQACAPAALEKPNGPKAVGVEEFGPEDLALADSLVSRGNLYFKQGENSRAEPLLKRALAIREKVLGPEHPGVAWIHNLQGTIYRDQGKYTEAEPLYKRALAILEKTFGSDHPYVAMILDNLGQLYTVQRKYAEADPLLKRALAIRVKHAQKNPAK